MVHFSMSVINAASQSLGVPHRNCRVATWLLDYSFKTKSLVYTELERLSMIDISKLT